MRISALVLTSIAAVGAASCYHGSKPSDIGKAAPDFTIRDSDHSVTLNQYRGKIVVLNFWATWCPPCIEETPSLNKLQKYIESRNAVVLGVSVDEDPAAYEKFLKDQGVVFPTFRDPSVHRDPSTNSLIAPIANAYGTAIYPETYVVDRHGKIVRKFYTLEQWDSPEMLAYFDSILGKS